MSGSLAIPNDISAQSGPQIPASYLDENWETIAAYVNSREVTFGPIAARPPAGVPGRWWYAIDQRSLYVDTGTGWILLSGTGETGGTDFGAAYLQLQEILDPAAGPMDTIRLYAKDDGAGNSILVYKRTDGSIIKLDGTTTGIPPHDHAGQFAPATHNHNGTYAPASHTHAGVAGTIKAFARGRTDAGLGGLGSNLNFTAWTRLSTGRLDVAWTPALAQPVICGNAGEIGSDSPRIIQVQVTSGATAMIAVVNDDSTYYDTEINLIVTGQ